MTVQKLLLQPRWRGKKRLTLGLETATSQSPGASACRLKCSFYDYFDTDNYGVLPRRTACHHKFFCAKGENCVNIHRELVLVCGDSALDYSNVNRWMAKFKTGRVSSTDLPRPGRPSSSRTDANKERVENLILSDRRVTVEDICAHTSLTHGTVMRTIKEDLQMTKVSARWVPKMLDDSKKEIQMTCSEEMLTRHTLIRIFWRSWSLWMRHGSPCSITKQKGSQNNGNIQTRHPQKNSELARLQRKFSIQFSGTRKALFSHILSQRP